MFASMRETRIVRSVKAARNSAGKIRPNRSTGRYVTSKPSFCRASQVSMTARCSVWPVTMWLPFWRYIRAAPRIARSSDSVAPDVNTISLSAAFIAAATWCRASSTAASASHPKTWLREAAFPNVSVKYGSMASRTAGSSGVVAL